MYYLTLKENKITIILVTQLLKMEVEEEEVLVILIFLKVSQIYLKIFLDKVLEEEVGDKINQIIEAQI